MEEMLKALKENEGLTLKNGKPIFYKTGWQVADHGKEATTTAEATAIVNEMGGNCGVWYSNGIYYVDHSFRVKTKRQAIDIGRQHNQISVFGWARQNLAYCQKLLKREKIFSRFFLLD